MSAAQRYQRKMEIFDGACDLTSTALEAFLDRACDGDDELRREIENMLAHDRSLAAAIDEAAEGGGAMALIDRAEGTVWPDDGIGVASEGMIPGADAIPDRIGGYRIIRKLGEGGMGQVFEAEQESPRRLVALKVIRAGQLSPRIIRRFEHEAFVLGQLQHPGIAHIYESGVVGVDGRRQPYFAMELIRGLRINAFAEKHGLNVRQRLELMARACDAVQHAHQKGIIHRDLKPANILVVADDAGTSAHSDASGGGTRIDAIGRPKILDFGIARVTDGDVYATTMQTDVGQIVGTLAYMSPEQVKGDSRDIDTRCDVYALGVVMYELLAGKRPFDFASKPMVEAARIIREDDATRLSQIDTALRGDVATIVAKAMEKDRERRYGSAADLAADLRRYLSDEPIAARPTSAFYQMRKFARRHSGLVGGAVAALLAIVIGAGFSVRYAVESRRHANEARERETEAHRAGYRMSIAAAATAADAGDLAAAYRYLLDAPPSLRGWEWDHLIARVNPVGARRQRRFDPSNRDWRCAFDRDGTPVAAEVNDDVIEIVDLIAGAVRHRIDARGAADASLAADGSRLASFFPADNTIVIWDAVSGAQPIRLSAPEVTEGFPAVMFFSRDASRLVFTEFRSVTMYDAATGDVVVSFPIAARQSVDATRHGERIVYHDGMAIYVRDVAADRIVASRPLPDVTEISISPSGRTIAAGTSGDRSVIVLDGDSLTETARLRHHMNKAIEGVRWSSDDTHLMYVTNGYVMIWKPDDGGAPEVLHVPDYVGPAWTPIMNRENSLVALSTPTEYVLLAGERHAQTTLSGHRSYVYFVKFSPTGGIIASHDFSGELRFWDAASGRSLGALEVPWFLYLKFGLGWADGGLSVATGNATWSALTGWAEGAASNIEHARLCDGGLRIDRLHRDEDQSRVWRDAGSPWTFIEEAAQLHVVDANPGDQTLTVPSKRIHDVVCDVDGQWFATNHGAFDMLSGECLGEFNIRFGLGVSPDGRRIAGGQDGGAITIFRTDSFEEVAQLRGHDMYVYDVDFSPDGTRLASASGDGTVRIWDARLNAERQERVKENEALRRQVAQRLDKPLADSSDLKVAFSAYSAAHHPGGRESEILKDELFARALKSQQPPALHDLPATGHGPVVRFDPRECRSINRRTEADAGLFWVQSDDDIDRSTVAEGGIVFERISVDSPNGVAGHYACSLSEKVVSRAVQSGWRLRARIRITTDGRPVAFQASVMLDSCFANLALTHHDQKWRLGLTSQDVPVVATGATFHDVEWRCYPNEGKARLFVDRNEIPDAPAPLIATHDPEGAGLWVQGHFTDAVVFGITTSAKRGKACLDIESFQFEALDSAHHQ